MKASKAVARRQRRTERLPWGAAVAFMVAAAYLATMAQDIIVGDPTEYTFVAHVLGVAHPPGYAFFTLLAKTAQFIVPWGTVAWRTHLVAVAAGALGAWAIFRLVYRIGVAQGASTGAARVAAAAAALGAGLAADAWQHGIHANPHIVTAAFLLFNCMALVEWRGGRLTGPRPADDRWLFVFCLSAGLGVTHHPLTVFAFPAYAAYVLAGFIDDVRAGRRTGGRVAGTVVAMVGVALLGLLPWLYFPLRAPALAGTQFPSDMHTLDGFLNLTLARGLRVNLFAFGWRDQLDRALVFASLLRLQFAWPLIALAAVGVWRSLRPGTGAGAVRLVVGALLLNYLFVINTVQDVMAYLLGIFGLTAVLAGAGALWVAPRLPTARWRRVGGAALLLLTVAVPLWRTAPHVSLRHESTGRAYIEGVGAFFAGQGEGAVLLNDWEHMTPLWYAQLVEGEQWNAADVTPVFVSSARPWLDHVFERLPGGPVYLSRFERTVFDAGFRLRPRGPVWQVVEPGESSVPPELTPLAAPMGDVELVGYALRRPDGGGRLLAGGEKVVLTLALRAPDGTDGIYVPEVMVDGLVMPFTTDSHVLSNGWLPGEVIVEAFEFALPHRRTAHGGVVTVRLRELTADVVVGEPVEVGSLLYGDVVAPPRTGGLLANLRQQVGLEQVTARVGVGQWRRGVWREPLAVRSGGTVHLTLRWRVLAPPSDSYTVFVHLIDGANRPIVDDLDYTPLGGAAPTVLWFPKWLPGQRLHDPYQMRLDGVPPGDYWIEVGMYEQFTQRRLHMADDAGNLVGDRLIVGPVTVAPP